MPNIIGVWEEQYDEYGEYQPFVYDNGAWSSQIDPYVWYEGEWQPIGRAGTLMIPFMTSDGEYFYTSDGKMFLVRNHAKNIYSVVQCGLTTPPTKTRYMVGETFDPTGMVIQVQYQNRGQQITRQVTHYTYSTTPLTMGTTSVTIHCTLADQNYTDITVPIAVYEPIISIAVTTPPTHTSYYITETFDPTGMVVTATINLDGNIENRVITDYTYPNTSLTITDTSVQLQWTYMPGYTTSTTQAITVSLPTVTLALVQPPTKTLYDRGDLFDPTGMVISATISGTYGNTTNIINDYFYSDAPLGSTSQSITITYIYEGQVTATLDIPITVMVPQVSIEITQIPNKNVYNLGDFFDPAGMVIEATVVTATGSETYEISNYTYSPTNQLSINDTSIQFSWMYEDQIAGASLPIAVRTQQVQARDFDGTETVTTDPVSGNPWIPWPTVSLATADTFTIGVKLRQNTANANNATVFSNIRLGENDYGIRLGLVNGNYALTWGTNNTLAYMPNTANSIIAMMIEHEANSNELLVTYYNLNSSDDVSYINVTSNLIDNEFIMAIGAGLDSNGDLNTTSGSNDKWLGTLIDFSIFNNTIPTREDVEKYLGLDIDLNACVAFESPNSFTLGITEPDQYWDGTLEYSTDSMLWVTWDGTTTITSQLLHGKYTILMRGINNTTLTNTISEGTLGAQDFTFELSPNLSATNISLKGDISALINYQNRPTAVPDDFCFGGLFAGQDAITQAHQLILPFTTLTESCYEGMFANCASLTTAPALPVTTLADACYNGMFYNCTSLTTAPALPATTLADACYEWMFDGCSSLTECPSLSATTLAYRCYSYMFSGCTSITVAPLLPATTLEDMCYAGMFSGCSSLTAAPTLSATTLAEQCYQGMFYECSSLINTPNLPATTLASSCYRNMFRGCTSLTTARSLPATTAATYCYAGMFEGCSSLTTIPTLPITILANRCYANMFAGCSSLTSLPLLSVTTLRDNCYQGMFNGCTNIKLSATQTGIYQKPYRIPSSGTGTDAATSGLTDMFANTGGTFTGTPNINTTYYIPYSSEEMEDLSVKFSSPNAFTLSINNAPAQHIWDGSLYTSTDLDTWTEWDGTTSIIADQNNSEYVIYINGIGNTRITTAGTSTAYRFKFTGSNITVEGNIATLLDWPIVANNNLPTMGTYAFARMFYDNSTTIINASNLILPFMTLTNYCYYQMFGYCRALTSAPNLPALTLVESCYEGMFSFCNSLRATPALPATTLAKYCYCSMFRDCALIITVPPLPVTTLAFGCYSNMFSGCSSLTTTPTLPATTLENYCYDGMFRNCSSLTTAPTLPATTLTSACYRGMFEGCTSLTTAPVLSSTSIASECYSSMFDHCTSLIAAPALPATTLAYECYTSMFDHCSSITAAPALPATTLAGYCYYGMFSGCTLLETIPALPATTLYQGSYREMFSYCPKIKISETQVDDYQTSYRIPTSGTATTANYCVSQMFNSTGGTFTGTPSVNTTYYTSNTVIT